MLKKILIGFFIVIAGILIYAFFQPDTYVFHRSIDIKSPPQPVFNLVNDFRNWPKWFYAKNYNDNEVVKKYEGNTKGTGSAYYWDGNNYIGAGKLEIIESDPPYRIVISMESYRPLKNHHEFEFTFKYENNITNVMYLMRHNNTYIAKLIHSFISVDTMFGPNFEKCLSNIKTFVEK